MEDIVVIKDKRYLITKEIEYNDYKYVLLANLKDYEDFMILKNVDNKLKKLNEDEFDNVVSKLINDTIIS